MPRPPTKLDPYRLQIELWLAAGNNFTKITELLKEKLHVTASPGTLQRRLRAWGIYEKHGRDKSEEGERALRARITELYADSTLKDDDAIAVLNAEGFRLTVRQLGDVRRAMGVFKCVPSEKQTGDHAAVLKERKRVRRMKQRRLKKGLPWPIPEGEIPSQINANAAETVPEEREDSPLEDSANDASIEPVVEEQPEGEEYVTVSRSYLRDLELKVAHLTAQVEQRQVSDTHAPQHRALPSNAAQMTGPPRTDSFQPSTRSAPEQYPSHYPILDPRIAHSGYT